MPKFELSQFGNDQELVFKPADGDLRCDSFGIINRWQNGAWYRMGDLDQLFTKMTLAETYIANLQTFQLEQEQKDKEALQMHSLEQEFDDLKEAGEYLRELEKMLRDARKAYTDMSKETKAKLKTFERLDVPYPE